MVKKERAKEVKRILNNLYPKTECFLHYKEEWQLLFAVILSAQATDDSVNSCTEVLFEKFPSLDDYKEENREEIYSYIKRIGLAKSKINYLLDTAKKLREKHNYQVPKDRALLMEMNGVGYKTSGVVLAELYNYPFIPVDTHVYRVSNRLGLVKKDLSPDDTEKELEKLFKGDDCINTHRQLILLGRDICNARNPKCESCPLKLVCKKESGN